MCDMRRNDLRMLLGAVYTILFLLAVGLFLLHHPEYWPVQQFGDQR
jgi:hypothetical protein